MNCRFCGSQLPPGAKVCPHCGTPLSASSSTYGASSSDPNAVAHPSGIPSGSSPPYERTVVSPAPNTPQTPSTAYGSDSYVPPSIPSGQQNPYTPVPDLYNPPPPPPPPPPDYFTPQAPYSPAFAPAYQSGQKPAPRFPPWLTMLLILLAVIVIGGSALIYYATVYQPNRLHAQATASAVAHVTGTAQGEATSAAQAVAQANATATAATLGNPYTHNGTLDLSDPLSDNSKGYQWSEDPLNCGFMGGAYHVKAPNSNYFDYCLVNASAHNDYADFVFEVQMQIIKGDGGGITFRHNNTATANFDYNFSIYQDGTYNFYIVNNNGTKTLTNSSNPAIKQGLNQVNLIAVVAKGSTITMYVNHQQIARVTDSTFSNGQLGVQAAPISHPTEVVFNNAKVWNQLS